VPIDEVKGGRESVIWLLLSVLLNLQSSLNYSGPPVAKTQDVPLNSTLIPVPDGGTGLDPSG
jgi:hypothetical protein